MALHLVAERWPCIILSSFILASRYNVFNKLIKYFVSNANFSIRYRFLLFMISLDVTVVRMYVITVLRADCCFLVVMAYWRIYLKFSSHWRLFCIRKWASILTGSPVTLLYIHWQIDFHESVLCFKSPNVFYTWIFIYDYLHEYKISCRFLLRRCCLC